MEKKKSKYLQNKEKWAAENAAKNAAIQAKREELKQTHGDYFQWAWVNYQYELMGLSDDPTTKKLDALSYGKGIKHVIAVLDEQGNVVKVGSSQIPKSWLLSYRNCQFNHPHFRKLFKENRLPDIEILHENMEVKDGRILQKQLSANKEGLKTTIKRRKKVKEILSEI